MEHAPVYSIDLLNSTKKWVKEKEKENQSLRPARRRVSPREFGASLDAG